MCHRLELECRKNSEGGRSWQPSVQRESKYWIVLKHIILTNNFQVDRSGKNRVVVPAMVAKDTSWQDLIFESCVHSFESGNIPTPQVKTVLCFLQLTDELVTF